MTLRYSVSLESDTQPVRIARGEIVVANARLGARRAVEGAFKEYPGRRWRSVTILLDRIDQDEGVDGTPEPL